MIFSKPLILDGVNPSVNVAHSTDYPLANGGNRQNSFSNSINFSSERVANLISMCMEHQASGDSASFCEALSAFFEVSVGSIIGIAASFSASILNVVYMVRTRTMPLDILFSTICSIISLVVHILHAKGFTTTPLVSPEEVASIFCSEAPVEISEQDHTDFTAVTTALSFLAEEPNFNTPDAAPLDLDEQNDSLLLSVSSIVALIMGIGVVSLGFSTVTWTNKLPTAYNFVRSMVTTGKSTLDSTKELLGSLFFGSESMSEQLSNTVQDKLAELKRFTSMDHTTLCLNPNYLFEFDSVHKSAVELLARLPKHHNLHHLLTIQITEGEKSYNEFKKILDSVGAKQIPTCVLLYGDGGIGKTTVRLSMANDISKTPCYSVDARDKYFPDYVGQEVMMVQEFAASLDMKDDLIAPLLTSIVSPSPTNFEGAFTKRQPCRLKSILMDTNTPPNTLLGSLKLQSTSLGPFAERIIWTKCEWTGPPEMLKPPYTRDTRQYSPDFSHIGFRVMERVNSEFIRKNWLPYVYPTEITEACKNYSITLPSHIAVENEDKYTHVPFLGGNLSDHLKRPMTKNELVTYESYFRNQNSRLYQRVCLDSLNSGDIASTLTQQADNKTSVLLLGEPGHGKTYMAEAFINCVSKSPAVVVHRIDESKHINVCDLKPDRLNIVFIDDFIPLNREARPLKETYLMNLYNNAPNGTIFITCTNIIPTPIFTKRYFDFQADYYYGTKTVYRQEFMEPGLYRRLGFPFEFENSAEFPSLHSFRVEDRAATHLSQDLRLGSQGFVDYVMDLVEHSITSTGEILYEIVEDIPSTADLTIDTPSLATLLDNLTPFGVTKIMTGTSPIKMSYTVDALREFKGVTATTFSPVASRNLRDLGMHFASIVRARGFTRDVRLSIGDDYFFLTGNRLLHVTTNTNTTTDIRIVNSQLEVSGVLYDLKDIIRLVYYADSLSQVEMAKIPIKNHGKIIQYITTHHNDACVQYALVNEREKIAKLAWANRSVAVLAFFNQWKVPMIVGLGVLGLVGVAYTIYSSFKRRGAWLHTLAKNDIQSFTYEWDSLTPTEISNYVRCYGWPNTSYFKGRLLTSDNVSTAVEEQAQFKHSNKYFYYKTKKGTWRRYDANGDFVSEGVLSGDVWRNHWQYDELDRTPTSKDLQLRSRTNRVDKYPIEYEEDYFTEQTLATVHTPTSPGSVLLDRIRNNLVNIQGSNGNVYGLGVCERFLLAPYHAVSSSMTAIYKSGGKIIQQPIIRSTRINDRDLALCQLSDKAPQFTNIVNQFIDESESCVGDRFTLWLPRGDCYVQTFGIVKEGRFDVAWKTGAIVKCATLHVLDSIEGTMSGDCGLPYAILRNIGTNKGSIYGLHTHGKQGTVNTLAASISRQELEHQIKYLQNVAFNAQSIPTPVDVALASVVDSTGDSFKLMIEDVETASIAIPDKLPMGMNPQPRHKHNSKLCMCRYRDGKAIAHCDRLTTKNVKRLFNVTLPPRTIEAQLKPYLSSGPISDPIIELTNSSLLSTVPYYETGKSKSAYTKTDYHQIAVDAFGPPGKEPVIRDPYDPKLLSKIPLNSLGVPDQMMYQISIADQIQPTFDSDLVQHIALDLSEYWRVHFGEYLTYSSPEVGLSGVTHFTSKQFPELWGKLRGLDLTTSAGAPARLLHHNHLKGDYFRLEGGLRVWKEDDDAREMKQLLDMSRARMFSGKPFMSIATTSLKDELLPVEKTWKARTFEVVDLHTIILEREVLGYYLACTNIFEKDQHCRVGMDPLHEWNDFQLFHLELPFMWTGDFSQWDKRVPAWLFEIYISILVEASDCPTFKRCVPIIIRNAYNSNRLVRNAIYEFTHGLPSGLSWTANGNSDMVYILMYLAWVILTGIRSVAIFRQETRISTYGDDLFVSVSEQYKNIFNLKTVSECVSQFGIQLGSDKKDGSLVPYTQNTDEVSFLSRTPKLVGATWVGALKQISIIAPFYYRHGDLSAEQIVEIFRNTYIEAVVWGEQFANQVRSFVHKVIKDHPELRYAFGNRPLPSFDATKRYIEMSCYTLGSYHCLDLTQQSNQTNNLISNMIFTLHVLDNKILAIEGHKTIHSKEWIRKNVFSSHKPDGPFMILAMPYEQETVQTIEQYLELYARAVRNDSIGLDELFKFTLFSPFFKNMKSTTDRTQQVECMRQCVADYTSRKGKIQCALDRERFGHCFCWENCRFIEAPLLDLEEQMMSNRAQMPNMNRMPNGDIPSMTSTGTAAGEFLTMPNDGFVEPRFNTMPSDTLTLSNTVDSQYGHYGTPLTRSLPVQQRVPDDYNFNSYSAMFTGSYQFVETQLTGAESRNYVLMHISTNPNSPYFPSGETPELAIISALMKDHKYSVSDFVIKFGATGTEGITGRYIAKEVPEGYQWLGVTPTCEELTAQAGDYQTETFSRDSNHEYALRPIVNSGFANPTNNADQVSSYTELWVVLETTIQQSFNENPPNVFFKAWLKLGSMFHFSTPIRGFASTMENVFTANKVASIIKNPPYFQTPAEYIINSSIVIGTRNYNLSVVDYGATMDSELPIELAGGYGKTLSTLDMGFHLSAVNPSLSGINLALIPYFQRGFRYPKNTNFYYQDGEGPGPYTEPSPFATKHIPLNGTVPYPEIWEVQANVVEALNLDGDQWKNLDDQSEIPWRSKKQPAATYPTDTYWVCRDASGCLFIAPYSYELDMHIDKEENSSASFRFDADGNAVLPNASGGYSHSVVQYDDGTLKGASGYSFGVRNDIDNGVLAAATQGSITVAAPVTPFASQMYQCLTLTNISPTFTYGLGSLAWPNLEHNRLYKFLLTRLGNSQSIRFNLTSPNGTVLLYCGFSANTGIQVNATEEAVQLTNPGPLLITNITTSSATITPSAPTNFQSVLAPAKSIFTDLSHLKLETQAAAVIGGALSGIGSGISSIFSTNNANEQAEMDRDLQKWLAEGNWDMSKLSLAQQKYIAEGGWSNQLELQKQAQANKLAYAGLTNVNRVIQSGNTDPGVTVQHLPNTLNNRISNSNDELTANYSFLQPLFAKNLTNTTSTQRQGNVVTDGAKPAMVRQNSNVTARNQVPPLHLLAGRQVAKNINSGYMSTRNIPTHMGSVVQKMPSRGDFKRLPLGDTRNSTRNPDQGLSASSNNWGTYTPRGTRSQITGNTTVGFSGH